MASNLLRKVNFELFAIYIYIWAAEINNSICCYALHSGIQLLYLGKPEWYRLGGLESFKIAGTNKNERIEWRVRVRIGWLLQRKRDIARAKRDVAVKTVTGNDSSVRDASGERLDCERMVGADDFSFEMGLGVRDGASVFVSVCAILVPIKPVN